MVDLLVRCQAGNVLIKSTVQFRLHMMELLSCELIECVLVAKVTDVLSNALKSLSLKFK